MSILLVLAFVLTVILIEYLAHRKEPAAKLARAEPEVSVVPQLAPSVVDGFRFADNVRYHPGHTWALGESPQTVRVGIDDFAGRLIGNIESVSLPVSGRWVRQGQPIIGLTRDGKTAHMVSPIEGIVTDVNPDVEADPNLARRDPYGKGWLMLVQAPEAETSFRNLIGGGVARAWLKEAAQRLRWMLPKPATELAQDGGEVVEDLTPHLTVDWNEAAGEFFLTG